MKFSFEQAYKYGMENGKPIQDLSYLKYALEDEIDIKDIELKDIELPQRILDKLLENVKLNEAQEKTPFGESEKDISSHRFKGPLNDERLNSVLLGVNLPPIKVKAKKVFRPERLGGPKVVYNIIDGRHRVTASLLKGEDKISAIIVD